MKSSILQLLPVALAASFAGPGDADRIREFRRQRLFIWFPNSGLGTDFPKLCFVCGVRNGVSQPMRSQTESVRTF
jgi:hypothetical protein